MLSKPAQRLPKAYRAGKAHSDIRAWKNRFRPRNWPTKRRNNIAGTSLGLWHAELEAGEVLPAMVAAALVMV
jgi:hypothetical protein